MKIEFKITVPQLLALAEAFDYLIEAHAETKDSKIIKSALLDLAVQIGRKRLKLTQDLNLFTKKTRVKLSLKYFEASYLESYLGLLNNYPATFPLGSYERTAIQAIKDMINQKLT